MRTPLDIATPLKDRQVVMNGRFRPQAHPVAYLGNRRRPTMLGQVVADRLENPVRHARTTSTGTPAFSATPIIIRVPGLDPSQNAKTRSGLSSSIAWLRA